MNITTASAENISEVVFMKKNKGSGKSIVAAARKMAEIVWAMLSDKQDFNADRMKGVYKPMILADEALSAIN